MTWLRARALGGAAALAPAIGVSAGAVPAAASLHILWLRGEVLRSDDGELLPVAPPPAPHQVFEPPSPAPVPPPPAFAAPRRPILVSRPEAASP